MEVYANRITHADGLIAAGDGGEANAHQPEWDGKPDSHDYGNMDVFGGEGGKTILQAKDVLTTTSPAHTSSGEGGDSYVWCSSADCQLVWQDWEHDGRWWTGRCECSGGVSVAGSSPGRGGDLIMLAPDLNVLSSARSGAGLYYEPNTITAGPETRIEAKDVFIFGGDDWTLNLKDLGEGAITATGDITLSVGANGVIDLQENRGEVFRAGGEVNMFADALLLDDGLSVEDVAVAEEGVETGPGKVIYSVSLTGPGQVSGQPGRTLSLDLALANAGPEQDTYTLTVSDSAGWSPSGLPYSVTVGGLENENLNLTVTLPSTVGERDVITVKAASVTAPDTLSETEIKVSVEYPRNAEGGYVVAIEGSPFVGDAVLIPLNHPMVETVGEGVSLNIAAWAEYEGIEDAETAGYEIHGTDGPDQISGSVGKDMIFGYGDDDRLDGGAGGDSLDGGEGENTLNGGEGADQFTGGTDADVILPGDADGNGSVDLADAILVLQTLTGMHTVSVMRQMSTETIRSEPRN